MKNGGFTLAQLLVVLAVIAVVAAIALPGFGPSREEQAKLSQLVPPMSFRSAPALTVVEHIVSASTEPLEVVLCSALEGRTVTIVTRRAVPVRSVLESVGMQLDGEYRLAVGHHGEYMRPAFDCATHRGPYTLVSRVGTKRDAEPR